MIFLALIEWSWALLIFYSNIFLLLICLLSDSKQKNSIIEYVDRKIKSMVNKRHEIELREKERPIHEKVFGALYERRTGEEVLNLHFSYAIDN